MPFGRRGIFLTVLVAVLLLLHGLPWLVLVLVPGWPTAVTVIATVVLAAGMVGFPFVMWAGHGPRHRDGLAVAGDSWLGIIWQLFVWSAIGGVVWLILRLADVHPGRWAAAAILVWTLGLLAWGLRQARRVPRVKLVDVVLDRLGKGLSGLRVVMIADTHFGPIDRASWSAKVAAVVDGLGADILVHVGDMADGSVEARRAQVGPLAHMTARYGRFYITGNHEYMSGALEWTAHMASLDWTVLHNQHIVLTREGSELAVAGIDDLTAAGSGVEGHGADLEAALAGINPETPVLLLAHQPKQIRTTSLRGIDLQLSGHTHGGQIWPFHLLVRTEQGVLAGLSRHGERAQLYISRGSGFWGPPFRIFAPSEITVLTLRSPAAA